MLNSLFQQLDYTEDRRGNTSCVPAVYSVVIIPGLIRGLTDLTASARLDFRVRSAYIAIRLKHKMILVPEDSALPSHLLIR
jgi:hypothetical protein